jgi:hypothetical protein
LGACTWKVIDFLTGSERSSVTANSTRTSCWPSAAVVGAVKRIRPSAVVRAAAPDSSPPTARAESSNRVSPSLSSRQSESTGTASEPPCGTL